MAPTAPSMLNQYSQADVNAANQPYQQDIGTTNTALQNLQNFQKNMQSGNDMYNQQLQSAFNTYGVNPAQLQAANQNLKVMQNTIQNAPKAIQQQGNGYGTTAGAELNNLTQTMGVLAPQYTNDVNSVAAMQNQLQNALTQAGAATQAGQQGQQMSLGALQNSYQDALGQMDVAQRQLANIQQLYQQQGGINAQQLANYNSAKAAYASAQAQAEAASAAMKQAQVAQQSLAMQQSSSAALQKYLQGAAQTPGESKSARYLSTPQQPIAVAPNLQTFSNPLTSLEGLMGGASGLRSLLTNALGNSIGQGPLASLLSALGL